MSRLSPFRFARYSRKGRRARAGAAAIEFAFVAPAFIFLVIVAFDLGLALLIQSALLNAAKDGARLIMINPATSSSTFVNQACSEMAGLVPSCSATLEYYVQSGNSFSSLSPSTGSGGSLPNTYSAGSLGQDVVVQLGYNRPAIVPWTMVSLNGSSTTVNTSNMLLATIVFQNEPP